MEAGVNIKPQLLYPLLKNPFPSNRRLNRTRNDPEIFLWKKEKFLASDRN
jgi:hypothetical protein